MQTTVIKKSINSKFAHTVYCLGISYNINSKWGISADYALSKKIESEMNKNNSVGMSVRSTFLKNWNHCYNSKFQVLKQVMSRVSHSPLAAPCGAGCDTEDGWWWCREKRHFVSMAQLVL